jgi:hypothetical protein
MGGRWAPWVDAPWREKRLIRDDVLPAAPVASAMRFAPRGSAGLLIYHIGDFSG